MKDFGDLVKEEVSRILKRTSKNVHTPGIGVTNYLWATELIDHCTTSPYTLSEDGRIIVNNFKKEIKEFKRDPIAISKFLDMTKTPVHDSGYYNRIYAAWALGLFDRFFKNEKKFRRVMNKHAINVEDIIMLCALDIAQYCKEKGFLSTRRDNGEIEIYTDEKKRPVLLPYTTITNPETATFGVSLDDVVCQS